MLNTTYDSGGLTRLRWSSADPDHQFPVENPATGELIIRIQGGGEEQVDAAVRSAHAAFQNDWRHRPASERGPLLIKCAELLEQHADELATLESLENGKPIADAKIQDIGFLVGVFRFFGSLVDKLPSEFYDKGNIYTSVVLEPLGVVGAIIPFNWPPIHTGGKVAAALAVGNTVVVKPSEQAPLTIMRIVELINTVLPPDVVHVLPGVGSAVPQAITAHPLVRKVTFTGSTKAGAEVARTAAADVTPVTLELGGKNPFIVFDDADLDRAVRDALEGAFFNKGEACTASSRLLVQSGVHDRFVERLAAGVRALKTGSGADPRPTSGRASPRCSGRRCSTTSASGRRRARPSPRRARCPPIPSWRTASTSRRRCSQG